MHLLLIGLRGSGKTTIGRILADLRPQPFVDLDDRTTALGGQEASECFRLYGEARWRELEAQALELALAEEPSIIALGGGTPTAPGALQHIHEACKHGFARVAWLDAPDDILLQRIGNDEDRPRLTDLPPTQEMAKIRAQREPVFQEIADKHIDTAALTMDEVVAILAKLAD